MFILYISCILSMSSTEHSQHSQHTQQEALNYIMTLCECCQERGGFTLDDAVQLNDTLKHIRQSKEPTHLHTSLTTKHDSVDANCNTDMENVIHSLSKQDLNHSHSNHTLLSHESNTHSKTNSQAILFLFQLLEKSQNSGHLSLEEAWTVFNAKKILHTTIHSN